MAVDKFLKFSDDRKGLIFAICLSAGLKIVLVLFMRPFNPDGVLYITAAQYFAAGNFAEGVALYPMPFYSVILCLAHSMVPNWEISAKLVSMASVVFATIPLYLLTADLFNRRAAFWACLAFAVAPLPNDWSVDVVRGPVFVFFVMWAVYFAQHAFISKRPLHFFLASVFSCLSVLLRIEGAILLLFFASFGIAVFIYEKESRGGLIKGFFFWMFFLIIFSGVCFSGMHFWGGDFNRFGEVAEKIHGVATGNFLDGYHRIYDQMTEMEKLSPYAPGRQNFAEIARHFMPLIYLFGLVEVFITVLFPFFIVPFFWAFKHPLKKTQLFVLILVCFYLLVMYVLFVERDFLQRRFLFAPAALLYPWIGLGLAKIIARFPHARHASACLAIFLIFFFVSPVFKTMHSVIKSDNVLRHAGRWMAANPDQWTGAKVLTNDVLVPFFAGMDMKDYTILDRSDRYDFLFMEEYALKDRADVLLLKVSNDQKSLLEDISTYKQIKVISGKKRSVYIYVK